mgnify:CR=1 FL=1
MQKFEIYLMRDTEIRREFKLISKTIVTTTYAGTFIDK